MAKETAILVRSVSPAAFLSLVPQAKRINLHKWDAVWQSDFFKKFIDFFKVNNQMEFSVS